MDNPPGDISVEISAHSPRSARHGSLASPVSPRKATLMQGNRDGMPTSPRSRAGTVHRPSSAPGTENWADEKEISLPSRGDNVKGAEDVSFAAMCFEDHIEALAFQNPETLTTEELFMLADWDFEQVSNF